MKVRKFILAGTEWIEVYQNSVGQVVIRQLRQDADHFIAFSPANAPELIALIRKLADLPTALPPETLGKLKLWAELQGKRKLVCDLKITGCGVRLLPTGLEVQLDCQAAERNDPACRVSLTFGEPEFREMAVDGIRLLDHKPPVKGN